VYTDEMLDRLVEIARGEDPTEARQAATAILTFGHGMPARQLPPPQDVEVAASLLAAINQRRQALLAGSADEPHEPGVTIPESRDT
jgi:hypothetical protein